MKLLEGIRIVSFNHFLMGPVGVQILADLGADVIAIEPIEGAFQRKWGGDGGKRVDDQTMLFLCGNRNKRSLALDLKNPEGLEVARELALRADVLTENFRPGVLDKLGLGYDALKADNPGLVYCAASGFGPDGPYAKRPGQDLIIQAMSGLMAITGTAEEARAVGVSAADHHGAALMAMGILAALMGRHRTGKGCRVDVTLLGSAIDLQSESFTCFMNGRRPESVRQPKNVAGWYYAAPYGVYRTADGEIAISLSPFAKLGEALGDVELTGVPDSEAHDRREEIAARIAGHVARLTTAECEARFEAHGIWHNRVNDYEQVVEDPQVKHNKAFHTVPSAQGDTPIHLVAHPVRYDGEVPGVRLPPQPLGAQTGEILRELGYDDSRIQGLIESRAIAGRV